MHGHNSQMYFSGAGSGSLAQELHVPYQSFLVKIV